MPAPRTLRRRVTTTAALGVGAVLLGATGPGRVGPVPRRLAQPDSLAQAEAAYARVVATLADSAIRQLDFFPAQTQLRVQMAFLDPRTTVLVPFDELAARSGSAVDLLAAYGDRLGGVRPPPDLLALHTDLASSLNDARDALARLASAAQTCQTAAASVPRCQAPFTSATSELARAYKRYLDTRARIGDRITDTGTQLPRFASKTPE